MYYPKVYTDFWDACVTVIPSKRHETVGKDSGLTSYIERLNNTLRQRVSPPGGEDPVVLQEVQEPHWGHLAVHP